VRIEIDASELRTLEVDLAGCPIRIQFAAPRVLASRVGPLLDREMRLDARGHRYLPNLPNAVTHEMIDPWTVEAGLGPDGDQGSLAHIIVYGSVNNAPVYDHTAALRRAAPRATNWLADVAEESVLGE
jgi:hypothetical protein